MATRYYGANYGAGLAGEVTEAGASPGKNIEVAVVYDASQNSKEKTIEALRAIIAYIVADTWPPA